MAKVKGMKVIGLTGESGGKIKQYCDVCINVSSTDTARIQEMHPYIIQSAKSWSWI